MEISFTTIDHIAREKLQLGWIEYGLASLIYHLSNNPQNTERWCYASKTTLGKTLGITEQGIHKLLKKLLLKKLIEKHPNTKHLRTTQLWYDEVEVKNTKQSLVTLNKVEPYTKQSLAEETKQSLDNIDSIDKDNNKEIVSKLTRQSHFQNTDIDKILSHLREKMDIPKLDLSEKVNRQYAWNLLRKSKTGVEGVMWLIDLASQDAWFKHHITSVRDLWNNQIKIISSKRGSQKEVAVYVGS